jgi:lipoprotein NlpI/transglutaminase-like putative cysteine protease
MPRRATLPFLLLLVLTGIEVPAAAQTASPAAAVAKAQAPAANSAANSPANAAPPKPASKAAAKPAAARPAAPDLGYSIEPEPRWVEPSPAFASPSEEPPAPRAPMHYALLEYQLRVEADTQTRFERVVRVVDEAVGLETASQFQVEFDPTWQKLAFHRIRVIRAGKASERLEPRFIKLLQRESQLERQIYDGRMTASIVLDDIRVGDRIEASFSVRGRNPVFENRFVAREWMVAAKGPVALFHIRLLAPAARDIRWRAPAGVTAVRRDLGAERELVFERRSVPQLEFDANAPDSALLSEQLEFSEFADWAGVAAWATRTFAQPPGSEVRAKAAEISAAAAQPLDRLALALDFVQREVRYFGTEIGANSHRPAPPDTVLRQRFGDCKDKVTLLVALLRELGIEAAPVVVSVHLRDAVGRMIPTPLAFDHVIARANLDGQVLWLDATRARQTGPVAKRQAAGLGKGLVAAEGTTALSDLPTLLREERMSVTDTFRWEQFSLDPVLLARIRYRGDLAEAMREAMGVRPAEEIARHVAEPYGRTYPQIRLRGPMKIEEVPGDDALDVLLEFDVPKYFKYPEQNQLTGDFAFWSLVQAAAHPNEATRTRPFRIGTPGVFRHELAFEYPEDVVREFRPPPAFDESNATFAMHWSVEGDRRHAHIRTELRLLAEEVDPASWPGYVERLEKIKGRLSGTNRISPLRLDQLDAFKAGIDALAQSMARGKVKVVTKEETQSQMRNYLLGAALAGGRLPPALRAEALAARGIAQDHIGREAEATADFDEAMRLAPDRAETFEAAAVNALMLRQDARAIELTEKSMQLSGASANATPRYTRAYANYFLGKYAAARDEFADVIQSQQNGMVRSYGAIWLYLATRRAGGDGAAAIRDFEPGESTPSWPYPVVEFLRGRRTLDQALEAAREDGKTSPEKACELWYYAAEKSLIEGDTREARSQLRRSLGTDVIEFNEYAFARRELDAIGR